MNKINETLNGNVEKKRFNMIFSCIAVLYPAIALYWSGISSLSVADILLLGCVLKFLMDVISAKDIRVNIPWFLFLLFLFLHMVLIAVFYNRQLELFTFLRYALYIFAVSILAPNYFEPLFALKILKVSGIAIAIFSIVQAVGIYVFGYYLKGYLSFFPIMRDELTKYGVNYLSGVLRVRGVFGEPSHLAAYLTLALTVVLFTNTIYKYLWSIVICVALVFSVSTTAFILMAFIWIYYFYKKLRYSKTISLTKILSFFLLVVTLGIIIVLFLKSNLYATLFRRITIENSYSGRMDSYDIFINNDFSVIEKIFGHGYIDSDTYLASYPLTFWRYGYCGLLGIVLTMFYLYKGKSILQKTLLIVFLVLCSGTMSLYSYMLIPYMAFICCDSTVVIDKEEFRYVQK